MIFIYNTKCHETHPELWFSLDLCLKFRINVHSFTSSSVFFLLSECRRVVSQFWMSAVATTMPIPSGAFMPVFILGEQNTTGTKTSNETPERCKIWDLKNVSLLSCVENFLQNWSVMKNSLVATLLPLSCPLPDEGEKRQIIYKI